MGVPDSLQAQRTSQYHKLSIDPCDAQLQPAYSNQEYHDGPFLSRHDIIVSSVKLGSCQVKQSIQVVQAVDTNYVDVIAVAGLVTDL